LHPAPQLGYEHLAGCELVPDRLEILKRLPRDGVAAEIGVDKGEFSNQILKTARPRLLYLIDADTSRISETNRELLEQSSAARLIEGDSSSILSTLPDGCLDWIYIDGDHRYDGVVRDIEAAVQKIKRNGFLVFNDYTVWSPETMYHCGVARAVNELCIRDGWRLVYLCLHKMFYNDVVIQRMGRV
jgi:precorrin-6B methylase 2